MPRLSAVARELRQEEARARFVPDRICFPPQARAVTSPARRKALKCGRRAGKTTAVAIKLLDEARKPPVVPVLYVTLTRRNAKEIIWDELLELNDRYSLGGVARVGDLDLVMPSGVKIQLRGANTEREIAKIRGKKFKFAAVDELQSMPDRIARPLIQEIIGPTLLDYGGGEQWNVGTPAALRSGLWWDLYAGKLKGSREQHHWTIRENERLPARLMGMDVEAILAAVREEYGWTEDDPTYRREFLGEDIEDPDALLYKWNALRNGYLVLPDGEWSYVFGIDIGFDDSDAIAVLGWRRGDRRVYLVEEYVQAEEDITDLATQLKRLRAKYNPVKMVIDEGGGGKKSSAELKRRHALPLEAAEKAQKSTWIRLINADLRKGMLLARDGSVYAQDCALVRKDPAALATGQLAELPAAKGGYHSDMTDAVLYGWRAAYGWAERDAPPPPPTLEQQLDAWETREAMRIEREKKREWWDSGGDE